MPLHGVSFNTRKALSIQIGESAAAEIADVIQKLVTKVEELERNKVSVTRIVPIESTFTADVQNFRKVA